jgi:hypothetical protein
LGVAVVSTVVESFTVGLLSRRRFSLPWNSGAMKPHNSPPGGVPPIEQVVLTVQLPIGCGDVLVAGGWFPLIA